MGVRGGMLKKFFKMGKDTKQGGEVRKKKEWKMFVRKKLKKQIKKIQTISTSSKF